MQSNTHKQRKAYQRWATINLPFAALTAYGCYGTGTLADVAAAFIMVAAALLAVVTVLAMLGTRLLSDEEIAKDPWLLRVNKWLDRAYDMGVLFMFIHAGFYAAASAYLVHHLALEVMRHRHARAFANAGVAEAEYQEAPAGEG